MDGTHWKEVQESAAPPIDASYIAFVYWLYFYPHKLLYVCFIYTQKNCLHHVWYILGLNSSLFGNCTTVATLTIRCPRCGLWNEQLAQSIAQQCLDGIKEFSTETWLKVGEILEVPRSVICLFFCYLSHFLHVFLLWIRGFVNFIAKK